MPFNFDFTVSQLQEIFPSVKKIDELYESLCNVLPKYDIVTTERVSAFLAQCGHESLNFSILKENLNYSSDGLQKIFRKYFTTPALAASYARQPEKIANRVYANRMGNGPESAGDGWKYRGRGAIQLTGHNNYQAFAESVGMDIDQAVEYLETLDGAIESACWYWNTNNINRYCDSCDMPGMTRAINGGLHGLDDRTARYDNIFDIVNS